MQFTKLTILALLQSLPVSALAAGAHEDLPCVGCHGIHSAKDGELIFAVPANSKALNPQTGQPYAGVTALCLGCHQTDDQGGEDIMPVDGHISHPFGPSKINPKGCSGPCREAA